MKAVLEMVKSRKVHNWKVCCHQWPHCCKENLDQRAVPSMKVYTIRVFCALFTAELEKARKEKCPIAPNLNVLSRGHLLLLESLDQMVQKFLLTLWSRGDLTTSVIAVSVAKALIARNLHLMLDHIDMDSSTWAKNLFCRMSFKKWKLLARSKSPMEQRKRSNFCIYMILHLWLTTIIFLIV